MKSDGNINTLPLHKAFAIQGQHAYKDNMKLIYDHHKCEVNVIQHVVTMGIAGRPGTGWDFFSCIRWRHSLSIALRMASSSGLKG